MDRNGPCMSRGSIILWIGKEEPSGSGVDGSRRLGGREDGGGERGRRAETMSLVVALSRSSSASLPARSVESTEIP